MLCWLVQDDVAIPEAELNAARRRAMFVLAAGGDPHRELDLGSVAAERLAAELETPERRTALATRSTRLPTAGSPRRRRRRRGASRRAGARVALVRARASRRRDRGRVARYPAGPVARPLPLPLPLPAVLPRRRAVLPQPRLLRPRRRPRTRRRRRAGAARCCRAWSLQVLHGKEYSAEAHQQAYRTVDLIGARGAIVDDRGRLLAGTTGHVVIDADAGSLGTRGEHGRWHPSAAGVKEIARLAKLRGNEQAADPRGGSPTTSSRRPSPRPSSSRTRARR